MSAAALVLLVVLPAAVGLGLALLARRWETRSRAASAVAVGTSAATVALAIVAAVQRPQVSAPFLAGRIPGGGLELAVDGLAAVVSVVVALVAFAVVVAAAAPAMLDAGTDEQEGRSRPRLLGLLLLFAAAMEATVVAASFPALLVAWELMGATSGLLVAAAWRRADRTGAGMTAFLTTRLADLGLYVAAGAALAGAGSLRLADAAEADQPWRGVVAGGVLLAALGKSAQLPFSGWLSRAMRGPSPVSALLHSATMVAAGGYLLLRVQPLLAGTPPVATAAVVLGTSTAVVLGVLACLQQDLKQLLAASTCAQVALVVVAAGTGAVAGGAQHLVAHALVKAALFLAAGAWLSSLGTKQLHGLRGAARRHPLLGAAAVLAAAGLAGAPPLPLWTTKDLVLGGAEPPALRILLLLVAALAGVYTGKVVGTVLAAPAEDRLLDAEAPGTRRPGAAPTAAVALLAAGALLLSAIALPSVQERLATVLGGSAEAPRVAEAVLSGATSLLALVVAAWMTARHAATWTRVEGRAAQGWLGLPAALEATGAAVGPVASAAAAADDAVHQRLVLGGAAAVRAAAGAAGRLDVRRVHGAVLALAAGARWLGGQARRPQTGLLHQYYFQLGAGVALLLALLLLLPT